MHRTPVIVPFLAFLLCICLLVAGCSSPDTTNQTAQPGDTSTTTTTGGALFTAGDIVKNPNAGSDVAWLVIGYDPATDKYERALIYPNADSSWGYRTDTRTDTASRSVMEKVYTEKLANLAPSSVPVVTPTTMIPEATPSAAKTVTATATTEVPLAPVIKKIIPDKGYAGTTVSISDLSGNNFAYGVNVTLSHSGSATIRASDVRVLSNKSLMCKFAIPADAVAGSWDVTVTNLDGRTSTFTNIFSVNRDPSLVTTTAALSAGTVPITIIDPPFATSCGYKDFTVTGSKFQNGAGVTLRRTDKPDIVAKTVIVDGDTRLRFFIDIPTGSMGFWDFIITNPDQTYGKLMGTNGFEVRGC
ncbi:MAG: hypothetical protein LUQ19_01490 [Methanoregula sp.]|nr:hypothetical protein [Methanoregula sp.]